jgi:hypothetical protein
MEKLKVICGINYINFVEGILNDYKTQNSLNRNYQEWLNINRDAIDDKNKLMTNVT